MKKLVLSFLISTTFFAQAFIKAVKIDGKVPEKFISFNSGLKVSKHPESDKSVQNSMRNQLSLGLGVSSNKRFKFFEVGLGFREFLDGSDKLYDTFSNDFFEMSIKYGGGFILQNQFSLGLEMGFLLSGRSGRVSKALHNKEKDGNNILDTLSNIIDGDKGLVEWDRTGFGGMFSVLTQFEVKDNLDLLLRLGMYSYLNRFAAGMVVDVPNFFIDFGIRWYL